MKQIPLSNTDLFALVDDEDYELVSSRRWYVQKCEQSNYARRSGPRPKGSRTPTAILMHRVIMGAKKHEQVDHVNHNGLDNRRSNLRICNGSQNLGNIRPYRGNKWKGIHLDTRGFYRVEVGSRSNKVHVGHFKREDFAAIAYNIAARERFGEFAFLNQVPNEAELTPIVMELIKNPKKRNGTSRFKGVCWCPIQNKWRVTRNKCHLGYFSSEETARDAYAFAAPFNFSS